MHLSAFIPPPVSTSTPAPVATPPIISPVVGLSVPVQSTQTEIAKSQAVRLMDVGLFGPVMIMTALNRRPPAWMRLAMVGVGIGTIIYNGINYAKTRQETQQNIP